MIIIDSQRRFDGAMSYLRNPWLRSLLARRRKQLLSGTDDGCDLGTLAHFIVVGPNDDPAAVEAVTILSDDGFAVVLLVPDREGVDRALLSLLRELAQPDLTDAR